jgi:DNA-binding NtrC family response regulator
MNNQATALHTNPTQLQSLPGMTEAPANQTYRERVAAYERGLILEALAASHGNQTRAARELKIPLRTLVYKLRALGIRSDRNPPESFQALKQ